MWEVTGQLGNRSRVLGKACSSNPFAILTEDSNLSLSICPLSHFASYGVRV